MLKFEQITEYEEGIVFSLLSQSFAEVLDNGLEEKIKQYEREVFENPDTVGACAFISTLNGQPIGLASWDPRQGPDVGIIGYYIRPSQRRKGYGSLILALSLDKAKQLGLKKVLVTCNDDNVASIKIIERNGGKLADKVKAGFSKVLTRRYWIE